MIFTYVHNCFMFSCLFCVVFFITVCTYVFWGYWVDVVHKGLSELREGGAGPPGGAAPFDHFLN